MIQNTPDQLAFETREARREDIFQNHASHIEPGQSFIFDVNVNCPSYVLVGMDRTNNEPEGRRRLYRLNGRLSFLDEQLNYFYPKGPRSGVWHHIEPKNIKVIAEHLEELQAPTIDRPYMWGYLVPLRESESITGWIDANALLHNMMYWESMLNSSDTGPLMRQMMWLAENAYQLEGAVQRGVAKVAENPGAKRRIDKMDAADLDKLMNIIHDQQQKIEDMRNYIMHSDHERCVGRAELDDMMHELKIQQMQINQSAAHTQDIQEHMRQMAELLVRENERMQVMQEDWKDKVDRLTNKIMELYDDGER